MTSVIIVDSDPLALEVLQRAFEERDGVTCLALETGQATKRLETECRNVDGLILNIVINGSDEDWAFARVARQANPGIAIGYKSEDHLSDWVKFGVRNSILIHQGIDTNKIVSSFLDFFRQTHEMSDHAVHYPISPPAVFDKNIHWTRAVPNVVKHSVRTGREELYDVLMQAPGFVAWLDGPEHYFVFANHAHRNLVERDVVGKYARDILPEIENQGFIQILDRIYRSGEPFILKGMAAEFHREDGTRKKTVLDVNYKAVRSAAGTISGVIITGEDVTLQHSAGQRMVALQDELFHVSRVNAMGMMVSTIAHELNQPLTAIHNYMTVARMIIERDTPDSHVIESLQGAAESALRAGDIIRNLRAMTTRREVQRARVPLAETLREATGLATLGQSNAHVVFDLQSALIVHGDKVLIQQIVFNLVRNAIEAACGNLIDITVGSADKGSVVEIWVSDTGPGIDRGVLSSVFESFVTTKAEGTGIGLTICKAIVEAHGGVITARNEPERGAIFCFTLDTVQIDRGL